MALASSESVSYPACNLAIALRQSGSAVPARSSDTWPRSSATSARKAASSADVAKEGCGLSRVVALIEKVYSSARRSGTLRGATQDPAAIGADYSSCVPAIGSSLPPGGRSVSSCLRQQPG